MAVNLPAGPNKSNILPKASRDSLDRNSDKQELSWPRFLELRRETLPDSNKFIRGPTAEAGTFLRARFKGSFYPQRPKYPAIQNSRE